MPRGLLALALIALATPLRAATPCAPVEAIEGPPVYVIMYGYPYSPLPGLDPLSMVDRDLVNMSRFFGSLGPRRAFVHGANSPRMEKIFGEARRPATWRALRASVDEVIADIEGMASSDGMRPRIYLYVVGHGHIDSGDRLKIFAAPEDDPEGPGFDGEIDSRLIAEHIVGPLAKRADVHLIVDTCHGYHMVQTRSAYPRDKLKPRPPTSMAYALDFAELYPGVGALLAGRGVTPEVEPYGGVFSHLVRSLAIGAADLDRDGIITYGEMADALPQVMPDIEEASEPEVIAPAGDRSRPFIDWRASRAAQVCFPGDVRGKYVIHDRPELYATVRLPAEPRAFWLPVGHTLGLETWEGEGRYFVAQPGPVEFLEVSPFTLSSDPEAAPPATDTAPSAWEPLPSMMAAEPTLSARIEPPPDMAVPLSAGVAALGGISVFDVEYRDDIQWWTHADLAGRMGYGRHRVLGEVSYARASVYAQRRDPHEGPAPLEGHRAGARIGYSCLLAEGPYEISGGLLTGLHHLWGKGGLDGERRFYVQDFAARAAVVVPVTARSRWSWRFDVELGVALAGAPIGPTVKLAAGLDFESIVYP